MRGTLLRAISRKANAGRNVAAVARLVNRGSKVPRAKRSQANNNLSRNAQPSRAEDPENKVRHSHEARNRGNAARVNKPRVIAARSVARVAMRRRRNAGASPHEVRTAPIRCSVLSITTRFG